MVVRALSDSRMETRGCCLGLARRWMCTVRQLYGNTWLLYRAGTSLCVHCQTAVWKHVVVVKGWHVVGCALSDSCMETRGCCIGLARCWMCIM